MPYLFSRSCSSSVQLWLHTWPGSGRIRSWMASTIQEGWGKKHSSSSWAGVIQFFAPTTTGGRIQIIESKLRDVGCQIAHERIAFTGVAGDDDAACFLHGFDDLFILEGNRERASMTSAETPY